MGRKVIILYIAILAGGHVFAQPENFRFANFSAKDGLADKFIYSATQDKDGYMWFGSISGLYRYDGHQFKKFRSPLDRPGASVGNLLQSVMTDRDGHLWLGSLTTLQWYDPRKNIFWQPDYNNPALRNIGSQYILAFSEGKYTWISTSKNFFYRFNRQDSSFLSFAKSYPTGASKVTLSTIEAGDQVYAVHTEGLYVFTTEGKYIRGARHPKNDIGNAYYAKKENAIYLSTLTSGILKFDVNTQTLSAIDTKEGELKKHNLLSVFKIDEGDIFCGGYPLHLFNPGKALYYNFYSKEEKHEFSIASSKIVNIYQDREKNLWLCGHTGLSMLPWQNNQIKSLKVIDKITSWPIEPLGVYQEPGSSNLLIANSGSAGLLRVGLKDQSVSTIINPSEKDMLKKHITGIVVAPDSSIYASDNHHFFKYDVAAKKLIPFSLNDQNGKPISAVFRNVFDHNGRIFISSPNNGFYIWDYFGKKLTHINKWEVLSDLDDAKDNVMVPCIADHEQNIWFTSNNGIIEYRQKEQKYYHHNISAAHNIPPIGEAYYIAEDVQHHIWVSTRYNGLYELYFEKGKPKWENYTVGSGIGLPSDFNSKIKQDPLDSSLWINNVVGLLRFDPIRKKVLSTFNMQNGFALDGSGYSFNVFKNKLLVQQFFGHISILDLNTYKKNTIKPSVVFNSVKVMDEERLFSKEGLVTSLPLRHNQNYIQLSFAALVLNNANRNQYAYILEGADEHWIYSGQINTVSYAGLKPGKYHFRVKAANSDTVWGDETALHIIIHPPFYTSWWFILLAVSSLCGLVYLWNRLRVQQARKEEQLKASFQQQLAETEMKALRAQMNPHFVFNSLNSIQKYILKNEHFEASQYLTKFSRLMRLILDHSNQNNIPLSSEIDLLKLYVEMEALRFDHKFDYGISAEDNIHTETMSIPSMLIQPYVENAIWHGLLHKEERGKLKINFSKDSDGNLEVTVDDDGVGRQRAAALKSKQVLKKKSYGMQITEDRMAIINRIEKINARCRVIDKMDAAGTPLGTTVLLTIPLNPIKN